MLAFLYVGECVSAYCDLIALSFEGVVALLWVWFPRLLGHFVTHTLALPTHVCALLMCVCALLMNAGAMPTPYVRGLPAFFFFFFFFFYKQK